MPIINSKYFSFLLFILGIFVVPYINAQEIVDDSTLSNQKQNNYHAKQFDSIPEATFGNRLGVDLEVLNYSSLSDVLQFKKLEIGVAIPDELAIRINRYLKQEGVYKDELNPFLEWQVDVEARFYHPASGTVKQIDGFYTRDYFENHQTDDWDELPTNFPFRLRFAPPLTGEWKAVISIRVNNEKTASFISEELSFEVIESNDLGYVTVYENGRNLKQGDQMIYPIGTNFPADFPCVAWGGTCYDSIPGDAVRRLNGKDTIYYGHNLYSYKNSEKSANVYAWNEYLESLSAYFQDGGKYIRTIQMPWSTLIEFEQKGNYYKRLHYAWEQDKILDSLEKYDALMIFNLMLQSPFIQYDHYGTSDWDWDYDVRNQDGELVTDAWVYERQRYAYNDKPQGQKKAYETLIDVDDLEYHKQRTRYYLSRYGYSTKIVEFEIFSEPFHTGAQSEVKDANGNVVIPYLNPYQSESMVRDAVYNYHQVISEYMKDSLQTNQLIGIDMGYAGSIDLKSITLPKIDIAGVNFYYASPSALFEYSQEKIVNTLWEARGSKIPIVFSEGGLDETYKKCSNYTQHAVDMATFPFTGLAGYLSWFGWRKNEEEHMWAATNTALQNMNQKQVLDVLREGNGNWTMGKQAAESDDEIKYSVEHQYYVSENKNSAVGYVKNRTYNLATQKISNEACQDFDKSIYNSVKSTSWNDVKTKDRLRIERLKEKTQYQVDWYSNYSSENHGYIKTDCITTEKKKDVWGFVLEYPRLGQEVSGSRDFPVVYYVIREGCGMGLAQPFLEVGIENFMKEFVPLFSNELQREKTYAH